MHEKTLRLILLAPLLTGLTACGGGSKPKSGTAQSRTETTTSSTQTPSSASSSANEVRASSGGVTATLHAAGHSPRVNRGWPISFTVTRQGRPAKADVRYQYLFAGNVVARRSHYFFTGHFSDVFRWPASAVGYPLTFRAVISSGGVTLNLDYPVKVVR